MAFTAEDIAAVEAVLHDRIAAATDAETLGRLRTEVAGKKGPLAAPGLALKSLAGDERKALGMLLKDVRGRLQQQLEAAQTRLQEQQTEAQRIADRVDVSLPGRRTISGSPHPLRLIEARVLEVMAQLGFRIAEGPLVEHDWFNFEALNMPADHPARDMQDTFFVAPEVVLRTHTSNVQIRTMMAETPPIRIVAPGMVFRHDEIDATHTPVFHQIEGLWLDGKASFADLKGVLQALLQHLFGENAKTRFRPSFFPFTEPSAEVDVSCTECVGRGHEPQDSCRMCRGTGWLEVLGAGMVDPAVLQAVGYDPEQVQGFAFGIGLERLALLLYGIEDIRLLYDNDQRFLQPFAPHAGFVAAQGR